MDSDGGGASPTTEPAAGSSAATDVSLREFTAARLLQTERRLDERHRDLRDADWRFAEERDRRYREVNIEKEKALKIKETADLAALGLAREIQSYKDEKANELRAQIESERGVYATKSDLVAAVEKIESQMKPISDYVTGQQGRHQGISASAAVIAGSLAAFSTVFFIVAYLLAR